MPGTSFSWSALASCSCRAWSCFLAASSAPAAAASACCRLLLSAYVQSSNQKWQNICTGRTYVQATLLTAGTLLTTGNPADCRQQASSHAGVAAPAWQTTVAAAWPYPECQQPRHKVNPNNGQVGSKEIMEEWVASCEIWQGWSGGEGRGRNTVLKQ